MLTSAFPNIKTLRIATTLDETDKVILLDLSANFTVTLPVVTLCAGSIISLRVINLDASYAATIATPSTEKIEIHGSTPVDTIVLNALGEYTLLYCDGVKWYELAGNH